jgi:hypothetical protein
MSARATLTMLAMLATLSTLAALAALAAVVAVCLASALVHVGHEDNDPPARP